MTRLRLLYVVLILALAGMACSLGSGSNLPATNTPSPRPTTVRQPTDESPTEEAPTEEPTQEEQPTDEPVVKPTATPSGAKCTTFKAKSTDVAWVTLDADNNVDQQVNSYPDGTTTITPLFEYDCVPK